MMQNIDNQWVEVRLGDAVHFISRGKSPTYVRESEVFALNQKAIRWGHIDKEELKCHDSSVKIRADLFVQQNDIVLNSTGDITIGRAYFFKKKPKNLFADSHVTIIRTNPKIILPPFLNYIFPLKAYQTQIYNLVTGATGQLELNKSNLCKLKLNIPPVAVQKRIADILAAYDDLIENNLQRIKILEKMAQLIYKEWFVHFRVDGKNLEIDVETGLPKGWKKVRIDELYYTASGGTPSREQDEYFGGTINWIKTGELSDGFVFESEEKITVLGLKYSSAKIFQPFTVIIAMYGATIGQLGITTQESTTNQACCALIAKTPDFNYAFLFLTLLAQRIQLIQLSFGAAQQNISQDLIKKFIINQPDLLIIKNFNEIIIPIFNQIKTLQEKNALLRQTRNRLLPRLMSGTLQV